MRYYLDTEFNGMGGALISMALVSDVGRELYLANSAFLGWSDGDYDGPYIEPWVRDNVMPIIESGAMPLWAPLSQWPAYLGTLFLGDRMPIVTTDWPDDIKYLCERLITGPGQMIAIPSLTFEMRRVDAYPTSVKAAIQHNAYWDAMALKAKLTVAA